MDRQKPTYYEEVRLKEHQRWDQFEEDPENADPWHLLFEQLRSDPRHVLSELLQNADDARATWAKATITDNHFSFEHNGRDFTRGDFVSLCRFGRSNKRFLHTIGFRGIGFKTTFTLGPRVELMTPTLAVAFEEGRFTEPVWFDAPPCERTVVQIDIDSAEKTAVLQKHLQDWAQSPIPLLFFRNIREIEVDGAQATKSRPAPGPISRAKRIKLSGQDVWLITSDAEPFPDEAVEEIRQGSRKDQLGLPPCHVEIIVGLQGKQQLYVVLPSNVTLGLPFSCNAPFMQDPARTGIKSPSTSPTNRWLLQRVGKLAASAFSEWLDSRALDPTVRAQAYEALLPEPLSEMESALGTECTQHILSVFRDTLEGTPILLTTGGGLALVKDCLGLPAELLNVWSPEQNLEQFAEDESVILAPTVSALARDKLASWGWLNRVEPATVVEKLSATRFPPRPPGRDELATLWSLLHEYISHLRQNDLLWYYYTLRSEYLAVVPVRDRDTLFPPCAVAVMGAGERDLSKEDWTFLSNHTPIADPDWLQVLGEAEDRQDGRHEQGWDQHQLRLQSAGQLLQVLGLGSRTGLAPIIAQAAERVFACDDLEEDGIKLAFIAARADVRIPDHFQFLCDDGEWRPVTDGLLADVDAALDYLPLDWVATRVLHTSYDRALEARDRPVWTRWVGSVNSRLRRFPLPEPAQSRLWRRKHVEKFAVSRGGQAPQSYKLKSDNFQLQDYDFPVGLWSHWETKSRDEPLVWPDVVMGISRDLSEEWRQRSSASIKQLGTEHSYPVNHGRLAAAWLYRLQYLACLPDQYGQLHLPAELYRTTAETAHLHDIEPFLRLEYDQPDFHDFLDLLGVRSKPEGVDRIVERIRALSTSDSPPLDALHALYRALDRSLHHLSTEAVQQVRRAFEAEKLIISVEHTWHSSNMIFQRNEGIPGVPVILHNLVPLQLWDRLGVPPIPTIDLMIAWLEGLSTNLRLSEREVERLSSVLARAPQRVWEELGLWLDRDSRWTSVDNLRWKTADGSATDGLFLAVRQATADLSMLPPELVDQPPFHQLTSLADDLQHCLVDSVTSGPAYEPPWLGPLAASLCRIRRLDTSSPDEDPDLIADVRRQAARLRDTKVQAVGALRVVPYLDGQPAGQSRSPQVLWHDQCLYVRQDGPRVYRRLVDEIAAPFAHRDLKRAISDCVERDPEWITLYFEEQFDLDPHAQWETVRPQPPQQEMATDFGSDLPGVGPGGLVDGPDDDPIIIIVRPDVPGSPPDPPPHPRPTPEERFARLLAGKGFHYDEMTREFHDDAGNFVRRESGMFHWVQVDAQGETICYYWIGTRSLRDGVELPYELWEMLKQTPEQVAVVLPLIDGRLREYAGSKLLDWVNTNKLELFPARYRLRMTSPP